MVLTRRRFLEIAATAMGSVWAGSLLDACSSPAAPTPTATGAPQGALSPAAAGTLGANSFKVAALSDLTTTPTPYPLNAGTTVFAYTDNGAPLVVSNICTHLACKIGWDAPDSQFLCPCHSSTYDRKGTVTGGPALAPLPSFPTQIKNGDLFVTAMVAQG
jgi:Rieske Fe-S protein